MAKRSGATQKQEKELEQLHSFYNKSVANLMRLDASDFEDSEDSFLSNCVGYDDMIHMEKMDEEKVLKNLRDRYKSKIIYVRGFIVVLEMD